MLAAYKNKYICAKFQHLYALNVLAWEDRSVTDKTDSTD